MTGKPKRKHAREGLCAELPDTGRRLLLPSFQNPPFVVKQRHGMQNQLLQNSAESNKKGSLNGSLATKPHGGLPRFPPILRPALDGIRGHDFYLDDLSRAQLAERGSRLSLLFARMYRGT